MYALSAALIVCCQADLPTLSINEPSIDPLASPSLTFALKGLKRPLLFMSEKIPSLADSLRLCRGFVNSYFENSEEVSAASFISPMKTP